ncbi:hypothetical protein P3T27_005903 [Kitasatospora sp. MAA19]|nr:hypothetical protein [Kitasatospora sp. MAA19]
MDFVPGQREVSSSTHSSTNSPMLPGIWPAPEAAFDVLAPLAGLQQYVLSCATTGRPGWSVMLHGITTARCKTVPALSAILTRHLRLRSNNPVRQVDRRDVPVEDPLQV